MLPHAVRVHGRRRPARPRPRARDLRPQRQLEVVGLRDLLRHTSTGRPHDMPLTEDWLVDFSRLLRHRLRPRRSAPGRSGRTSRGPSPPGSGWRRTDRRSSRPARSGCLYARGAALGPIADRPRDRGGAAPVRGVFRAGRGRLAGARWPTGSPTPGLGPAAVDRLAADPPLTLFLMLEAEADTGGKSLGRARLGHHGRDDRRGAAGRGPDDPELDVAPARSSSATARRRRWPK